MRITSTSTARTATGISSCNIVITITVMNPEIREISGFILNKGVYRKSNLTDNAKLAHGGKS